MESRRIPSRGSVVRSRPTVCRTNVENVSSDLLYMYEEPFTLRASRSGTRTFRELSDKFSLDNTTKALQDAGRILGPSLFVSIFDPTLDLLEALQKNYTRLEHMPANGLSTVTLGLHHRQALNEPGKYDYELSISSTPSMDLRCDSSAEVNMEMACWMTIFLSFPSFSRRVTELNYKMSLTVSVPYFFVLRKTNVPQDVLAEAGAWFSLFQMIAWLVSTQAFE